MFVVAASAALAPLKRELQTSFHVGILMKARLSLLLVLASLFLAGFLLYLRYKTIAVMLIDLETGQPVTTARIQTNFDETHEATSQPGLFEVGLLVNPLVVSSPADLRVKAPGYRPGSLSLLIPRWQTKPTIQIQLEPTVVKGHVIDAQTEQPLASVRLSSLSAISHQITTTTSSGSFRFDRLWINDQITVEPPPGYQPLNPIVLQERDLTQPLDVTLKPTQITGWVVNIGGEPVSGVQLSAGAGVRHQIVTSDATGQFTFYRLIPQDQVMVRSPEYLPAEVMVGQQAALTLTVEPHQLQVQVWDMFNQQPMAEATITISRTLTTTTDIQGHADLSHIPVPSQLTISKPGFQTITVDYLGDARLELAMALSAIQGFVRDRSGQPIPEARLYVGETMAQADTAGHFVMRTPLDDQKRVVVQAAGYKRGYTYLDQTGLVTSTVHPPVSGVDQQSLTPQRCSDPPPGPPCFEFRLDPFEVKALYIPFRYLSDPERMINSLDFVAASDDLNALVVDVKGDFGRIAWFSEMELVAESQATDWLTDGWLPLEELLAEARQRDIYMIARFVVFKDDSLAHGRPDLAAVTEEGTIWLDGEELAWTNPFKEEVWDYNIALAEEVAAMGFDEINFDYIRFPSDGDVMAIAYQQENSLENRTRAIGEFAARMADRLRPYQIFISADLFGLTVWVPPDNDMNIGQRVIDLAPHIDYLCPMVYPSTFAPGTLGYDDPSSEPYNMVYYSQLEAIDRVSPRVKVRPWLQAYWYDLSEMRLLRQAAEDAGAVGWAWWNAAGVYDPDLFGVSGVLPTEVTE